ncbi:cytochrome P450 [Nocardia nova]|uniref:cytochrome P450 n=1 Tax=Nocardia nova TaxID=37330 RepID=UPI0033F84B39
MTTYTRATAPGNLPLIGHAGTVLRDPLAAVASLPQCGDLVDVRIGPARMVVVCHPDLVRTVLSRDRLYDKGGPLYDRLRQVVGTGVATCTHDEHLWQRRLVQPALHGARMPGYAAEMTRHISEGVEGWRDGAVFEVYPAMTAITSRIIARTLFSSNATHGHSDDFAHAMSAMLQSMVLRMLVPPRWDHLPLPGRRRFDEARTSMRRIGLQIIDRYRSDGIDEPDVLSMLLGAHTDDDRIVDELTTLYLAGTETSAATLAWACHLLARHPDVAGRLRAEADAVLCGRAATWDDLASLTYTRQVIDETLRLFPPGWLLTRTATADTELGGWPIPEATTIVVSPYQLHHRGGIYPDPETFDPDRWARDRPPTDAYIPFAAGGRRCTGSHFALVQTTLALATIATTWHLEAVPGPIRRGVGTTLAPNQLRLRAHKRTPTTRPATPAHTTNSAR